MKDEKKKMIITIVGVALLLLVTIGASYAYFTSNISSTGNNKIDATTVVLASARMDYGDKVVANGILPGNKILKTITVTGSGPDNAVPITATIIITPDVTDFGTHVKYTIYAVENSDIDTSTICESPKPTTENGMYYDAMECNTTNLGSPILEGTFERKKVVTHEVEVTSTTNTTYYLLIEYVNDENGQDEEQGKTFTINIDFQATYEAPSIKQVFKLDGVEVYDLPLREDYYDLRVTVSCSDNKERTWNYETWSLNIEEDLEESCVCNIDFQVIEEPTISQIFMLDGNVVNDLPTKQEYYEVAVTCSDNKPRTWNYETWSLNIESDLKESCSCSIDFNKNMNKYIESLANTSSNLIYDGTKDNNLRYTGSNPDNYVKFNNELWRIIGVMNNIIDSEGNVGSHIKIIRNESIGNYYWNGSSSTTGTNNWSKSTLNTSILNGTYYNGLTLEAKNSISNIVWNLGGYTTNAASSNSFYTAERGSSVYGSNPVTYRAYVGLIYPSDYGYAVGGSVRNVCLGTNLANYDSNNCYINDWLYINGVHQWTLTSDRSNSSDAFAVSSLNGELRPGHVYSYNCVTRPVVYLKSNIQIIADSTHIGSSSKPYELKLSN